MLPFNAMTRSFFLKIVCFTTLLSFLPYTGLGLYSLIQVKSLSNRITEEQTRTAIDGVLAQKLALLEKEAELNQAEFIRIETALNLLQKQAEYIFTYSKPDGGAHIALKRTKEGYMAYPDHKNASLFLSSIAPLSPRLRTDLETAAQLEPLLKEISRSEPSVKAAFFCFSESGFLIYPPINLEYEVSLGQLPTDMHVQDYEFYYIADAAHNPDKGVIWTRPYEDLTHWKWVVTASAPVYLPNGQLRGVLGIDFPLDHIVAKFLSLTFSEPNAFAFITGEQGQLIASNQSKTGHTISDHSTSGLFDSNNRLISPIPEAGTKTKGVRKISSANGDAYLLFAPISNSGWTMNFYVPEADIAEPIAAQAAKQTDTQLKNFIFQLLFFLIVGAVLLVLFSYRFSRTVTEPVKRLTTAIQKSGEGYYRQQIEVTSQDEIGNLTHTFNWMSHTIQQLISELKRRADQLEEKIGERTRDLQIANERLLEMYKRLKHSEQARSELIVQISHDLKTPLTSIKGYLQALAAYELTPEKEEEFMRTVLARTNHTIQLIDDLFELSSLEIHASALQKEWLTFDFLLDYALDMAIKEAEELNIEVRTNYPSDLPLIFVDPAKMNRALVNILGNAIKYSREKELIRIHIVCYEKDGQVVAEITDNGMGISEENMKNIFSMFYREPKAKEVNQTGSGLGTSIAKKIIEKHGGDISIVTTSDVGTTIRISLPCETDTEESVG
ncbi:ATP-binding protein [Aneurinibacillus aneurinilyticus]|uniref:histidine kinase n=1 Tax=Aneurinibacillus aneurinilyticus TaxID=1391 RepID=A0A848D1T7_ANEAE|nr:ATP-binding protein [Aneurinibacillus aneurinilyticus]NME99620.1 HAMP domain-containing protein [Aneurinibacillus aneurinilyticus]